MKIAGQAFAFRFLGGDHARVQPAEFPVGPLLLRDIPFRGGYFHRSALFIVQHRDRKQHLQYPAVLSAAPGFYRGRFLSLHGEPDQPLRQSLLVFRDKRTEAHSQGFRFGVAVHLLRAAVPGDDPVPEVADDHGLAGVAHQSGQPQRGFFRELPGMDVYEFHHDAPGPAFAGPVGPENKPIPAALRIPDFQLPGLAGLDYA